MSRLIFVLLVVLIGCQQSTDNHPILKFHPSSDVFEDGYVSKYYRHYYPKNKDSRAATEITYTKFRKEGDQIFTERYNAGFDLVGISESRLADTEIIFEKLVDIRMQDTFNIEILNPVRTRWEPSDADPYTVRYQLNDTYYRYVETQQNVYDTLIDGKPAKVFNSTSAYTKEEDGEEVNSYSDQAIYLSEVGFYSSLSENENYVLEVELMEQMPVEEFERRADHDKHRIAWIDPENTLDAGEDFNICGHERFIADYYNSTPDGRYIHGKRALLDTVYNNLDESKMLEQNGMLVFRFVVNCEGKPGRFTVDGYDFMYQPIKFEQETIDHLYGILRMLEDWRPVVINDEARDAYFYITFKIDNGKITDILP
ncbi:hypothetical protein [Ekhidna sp. To15]|uniref:hypothetical protein n=1 Tax=Ekhidna sp. To15 TaxID=3395267 RepID=UPI003F52053B